jgi:small-conductance mechanosensitive channel
MEFTSLHELSLAVIKLIRNFLESIFGTGISAAIHGALTWGDVIAIAILAVVFWILGQVVTSVAKVVRRRAEQRQAEAGWAQQIIRLVASPIRVLIWLAGVYLLVAPAVYLSQSPDNADNALEFVGRLLDFGVFGVLIWVFYRTTELVRARLELWAKKSPGKYDDLLIPPVVQTLRVVLPLLAIILGLPILGLPAAYDDVITKVTALVFIGVVAWILFQGVKAGETFMLSAHDIKAADNLEARKIHTQVRVLSKTAYFIIILFTIASMLMVFEEVRRFGTNILASAGVVGIILGFAAQRTIANLFAGFQLAMAQPIRLDDVVIVENEWGRIEEITLTYVVIRIWDQRRLIVPLSHFIEKPFQNWTRTSSEIMGSVFFFADYTVPLESLREELKRIIENHPKWDRKFWNLQVTDANDRTLQLRVLATASDSGKAWDLRCDVREQIITFLQKNHPEALPKFRTEFSGTDGLPAPTGNLSAKVG